MRLSVQRVLEILATYPDRAEIRREFPELEEEDMQQALEFSAATMKGEAFDSLLPTAS
jgi:uncharacterized protein (DUF433 family)